MGSTSDDMEVNEYDRNSKEKESNSVKVIDSAEENVGVSFVKRHLFHRQVSMNK